MSRYLRSFTVPKKKGTSASGIIAAIRSLTFLQYAQFFSGWLAWTCDAFDFFTTGIDHHRYHTYPVVQINRCNIIFGISSDRFGRRWPLTINLLFCCACSLGTSFLWVVFLGLAASPALENLPVELRGLASGILQQGYAVGYLFAAVVNLTLVPTNSHTWRAMFWTGSSLLFSAAVLRSIFPESAVFLRAKEMEKAAGTNTGNKTKVFLRETKEMLKRHWLLCIYAVLLMTGGFNFLSHGFGVVDLYPTYLQASKGFSSHSATIATIIGNCGAIAGGGIAGYTSHIFELLVGAFIPLWIVPTSFGALAAGAFCVQFGVQGAWGVIPIQLAEMSPPAFRATFPGVAYQLGNMISAASAQIEATGAKNFAKTTVQNGVSTTLLGYAQVQGIFIGVIVAFVILITIVGPENHSSHFEKAKIAFEEGAGRDVMIDDEKNATDSIPEDNSTRASA